MLNHIVLVGNLGGDPEMFYSSEGNAIASFSLAFRANKKDKTASWMKVTAFGRLAEASEKYLHKGAKIAVSGSFSADTWKSEGQNRTTFKIIANNIEFIRTDGRGFEGGEDKENIPF